MWKKNRNFGLFVDYGMSEKKTVILTKQKEKYRYISCFVFPYQSGIILPLNDERGFKNTLRRMWI